MSLPGGVAFARRLFRHRPAPLTFDNFEIILREEEQPAGTRVGLTADFTSVEADTPVGKVVFLVNAFDDLLTGPKVFGADGDGADQAIVRLQVLEVMQALPLSTRTIRVIMPSEVTAQDGGVGSVVSGTGTSEVVFLTNTSGQVDIRFDATAAITRLPVRFYFENERRPLDYGQVGAWLQLTHA